MNGIAWVKAERLLPCLKGSPAGPLHHAETGVGGTGAPVPAQEPWDVPAQERAKGLKPHRSCNAMLKMGASEALACVRVIMKVPCACIRVRVQARALACACVQAACRNTHCPLTVRPMQVR